jgi:hypothetical protein
MPYVSKYGATPWTLAGLGGLGVCACDVYNDPCSDGTSCTPGLVGSGTNIVTCPSGQIYSAGACVDDLSSSVPALIGTAGPNAGLVAAGSGAPTEVIAPATSNFLDWVDANSTILVVGIAAAGFVLALVSGKRR